MDVDREVDDAPAVVDVEDQRLGRDHDPPVDLDGVTGDPVRIVTNVVDATEATLSVDTPVRLTCERVSDEVGLPRFRIAG